MPNPFHYGTPATGDQFTGREAELNVLLTRARDGIGVVLVSPRRYGKTSLLIKASDVLAAEGRMVVNVNAFGCLNAETFASRLAGATFHTPAGRWHRMKDALADFVRRFRVTPSIEISGQTAVFRFAAGMSPRQLEDVITDVYAALAEGSTAKKPAVLVIDEFQELPALGEHLPGLFKSLLDAHPQVALVIAGSRQHLLERLVLHQDAPLFGMLTTLSLGEIPPDDMAAFLVRRAADGGKQMPDEAAATIVALAGPAPNDVQQLAYEAFGAAGARRVSTTDVERAMALAADHGSVVFQSRFDACSGAQKRVLLELAQRPTATIYAAEFRDAAGLKGSGGVQNAVAALVAHDLVVRRNSTYVVADPFLAQWLRGIAQS